MKRLLFFMLLLAGCTGRQPKEWNIIPAPVEIFEGTEGSFRLRASTVFVAQTPEERDVAAFYAERLRHSTGWDLKIQDKDVPDNAVTLRIEPDNIVPEGYLFESGRHGILVRGGSRAGLFYGMATLMQLLPAEIESGQVVEGKRWTIPSLKIGDFPRFSYRGIHLDPCRHFMPLENIRKNIDILSQYKINTVHLHLTEDQGWRIEIGKYPQLVEKGAVRTEGEGFEHRGYYTQEELKDLVEYAARRSVTLIPEIELPGHALAAVSACPELSCDGRKTTPRTIWGVEDVVMCAGKESTFRFIEDVIAEVAEIFPSRYIHIGGDECPKTSWEKCPLCQRRIREEGLDAIEDGHTPEQRLQSYFIKRVEKIVASHGRQLIGWDEILEGGLPESAAVMSWRGVGGGVSAALQGHPVIMTPSSEGMYFDHYQGSSSVEPVGIGGYAPLEKVYAYDPVPDTLVRLGKEACVLGVQANNWSEYYYTEKIREYRMYPRALALAEIAWTLPENKDFKDFCRRVDGDGCARLELRGVNYHIPLPEQDVRSCDKVAFLDEAVLSFHTTRPMRIVYTLDGTEPDAESEEYVSPLRFRESAVLKIASQLPTGKLSPVRTIRVCREVCRPATELENGRPGLEMFSTDGLYLRRSDLEAEPREWVRRIVPSTRELRSLRPADNVMRDFPQYAAIGRGYIRIPEDGVYYFRTNLNDLSIDGERIIDNDGAVKRDQPRNHSSIALAKGLHRLDATFLGHIIGGFPSNWDGGDILLRSEKEDRYRKVTPEMLWH